jgi:hypothetical protein
MLLFYITQKKVPYVLYLDLLLCIVTGPYIMSKRSQHFVSFARTQSYYY